MGQPKETYLIQTCGLLWVVVDLRHEFRHDSQFGIICANMDIEMLEVVLGRFVPFHRMVGDVISIADDGWFAILRTRGTVEVVTIKPDAGTVQYFPCLPFGAGLLFDGDMQIKIGCCSI